MAWTIEQMKNLVKNSGVPDEKIIEWIFVNKELNGQELIAEKRITEERFEQLKKAHEAIIFEREREEQKIRIAEQEAARKKLFDDIYTGVTSDSQVLDLVNREILEREDIKRLISRERYDMLFPEPIHVDFGEWKDIPPLKPNRVDVFVLGIAASGKSCFMSGLLNYVEKMGCLSHNITNISGYSYANKLILAAENGKIPPRTSKAVINYMECDFINPKNNKWVHPLTFVEMSGEVFEDCNLKSVEEIRKVRPKFAEFLLDSPNDKIIFLALDYSESADQRMKFDYILRFLKENKVTQTVRAVGLLVTKWDRCPDKTPDAPRTFLSRSYKNLVNLCNSLEREEKNLKFEVIPYSLGDFKSEYFYLYDEKDSKTVFEWICGFAHILDTSKKKTGIFGGIFNR